MISSSDPASVGGTINYSAIAGFYSQLAGVLAGFAFAGLIALIAAQLTARNRAKAALHSFAPLISAFIGLVAASLNYAIISSEGHTARGAALETVGGLGFCVAGLMLFYSILVLLHGVASDVASTRTTHFKTFTRTIDLVRRCIIGGLAPLVMFLLYGGVSDQETFWYAGEDGLHWPDYLGFALVVFVLLAGGSISRVLRARSPRPEPSERLIMIISAVAVAVSLLSVAGTSAVFDFMSSDTSKPTWVVAGELLLLACVTIAIVFSSAQFILGDERPALKTEEAGAEGHEHTTPEKKTASESVA